MAKPYLTCHSPALPNRGQERTLKVRDGYHSYQLVQPLPERTPVALIELKGHWLHQAGFHHDTPVRVRVMAGCLVLTVD